MDPEATAVVPVASEMGMACERVCIHILPTARTPVPQGDSEAGGAVEEG
jgi:hypothetical protein